MSQYVLDYIHIKFIEKQIGRTLDDIELTAIKENPLEPLFFKKTNGQWASYIVPIYAFPDDVMLKESDLTLALNAERVQKLAWFHKVKDPLYG